MNADHEHQHLPQEVVEIILDFALRFILDQYWNERRNSKRILFRCALVCKSWLWPARRRLQSFLYLKRVSIASNRILAFSNAFRSPLCTLDATEVQTLTIEADSEARGDGGFALFPMSALDGIFLPSLHTLSFQNILFIFNNGDLTDTTVLPFNIRTLKIENVNPGSFESATHVASLLPSLETLIVRRTSLWNRRRNKNKKRLSYTPPPTLRKLDVDTLTFLYVMEWLVASKFDLSNIASVSIHNGFNQYQDQFVRDRLPWALKLLKPNVECKFRTLPPLFSPKILNSVC